MMMKNVSRSMPATRKKIAATVSNSRRSMRFRSSSSSVATSSSRVYSNSTVVAPSLRSAASTPDSRAVPGRPSSTGSCRLTAADEKADYETDACGHAHRAPWMIVHVLVGHARSLLAPVDHDVFRFRQLDLGAVHAVLQLLAYGRHFFAGLAGRRAQQLFDVGDDDLEVLCEFVLADDGFGGHGIPLGVG